MANGSTVHVDYEEIATRLKDGAIVPFFGAGASIACGLPSGAALAERLVARSAFPDTRGRDDLALVSSYLVQKRDSLALDAELRKALGVPAEPCRLHRCFANPRLEALRIFVTTNYDDLIERALEPRVPWVVVDRGESGSVWCRRHGGTWEKVAAKELGRTITDPTQPIVLKLHGSLDRENRDNDAFLITEEHYVDFLGRPSGEQIPAMLATAMRRKSFLFLGYGLRDWNIRVLLRKLAEGRGVSEKIRSWAIVRDPGLAEQELWRAQDVEMYDIDLGEFVNGLEAVL